MSNYQVSKDFLLDHAYRNVWCTPSQDKQANLALPRVTPTNGVWTKFDYQWRSYKLPATGTKDRFHLYQIGQVFPELLGLVPKQGVWISAKEAMESNALVMDLYNSKGIMVPRSLCWYIVSGDKNILLAVRKPSETPKKLVDIDLENEELFMRVYSNAYFNRDSTDIPAGEDIILHSAKPKDIAELNNFQAKLEALPSFGGRFLYVNGRRVNKIDLVSAKVGDYVECLFDASIKREVFFKVSNLQEFESTLDNIHKFLLHYPGTSDVIDYQDDVDVYVGERYNTDRWQGVYLHKNDSRTLRMVTHRDYSVPVIRVNGAKAANAFLANKEVEVRLTIRNSGYSRPLVFDNNRIFELYKLKSAEIVKAMVGLDATVPVWTASALEASSYTALMRQKQGKITQAMVQEAYGYNAISKLVGDTPARIELFSGQKLVTIPPGLVGCATVYEYDGNGRLVYFTQHTVDNTYSCQNADTAFVEVLYGLGGTELEVFDNTVKGTLNELHNYRFYTSSNPTGPWSDRTGDPYYFILNGQYNWVTGASNYNRVLSNKRHLAYSFELAPLAGAFEFDLTVLRGGVFRKLDMPLGELDLFFNGYSLIEGLDFIVKDARVLIITKKYFNSSLEKQVFTVRYTGFCNKDMSRTPPPDSGFVYHGVLSVNNRFDIRDDKVLRIVCNGQVHLREDISFAEDGVSANLSNALNGAPYAIRDVIVPMNNYLIGNATGEDKTYSFRAKSQVIDKEVADYMTMRLPQDPTAAPNVIADRYPIYSPFISRLMADMKSGVLADDKFFEQFGDEWLRERLASYLYLLEYDLSATSNTVDNRYVVIHAHPYPNYVTVNAYQYRVLQRAAKLFTRNVELSSTVNVQ